MFARLMELEYTYTEPGKHGLPAMALEKAYWVA
jgi:hypothetical protein